MMILHLMGGTAARLDTNWSDYQSAPGAKSFNAEAAALPEQDFRIYLQDRGLGVDGQNLRVPFAALAEAKANGVRPVFNFGVSGEWARPSRAGFPAGEAGDRQRENALADPAYPGQFLADFITTWPARRTASPFSTM